MMVAGPARGLTLTARCGSGIAFDSATLRREADAFSGLGDDASRGTDVGAATSLRLDSAQSQLPSSTTRVCSVELFGPAAPFSLAYSRPITDSDAAPSQSQVGLPTYRESVRVDTLTIIVESLSSPTCSPVITTSAVLLEQSAAAAASASNLTDWQVAAAEARLARFPLRTTSDGNSNEEAADWVQTLPYAAADAVAGFDMIHGYTIPGTALRLPVVIALPAVGCTATIKVYHRVRADMAWFVWAFASIFTLAAWGVQAFVALNSAGMRTVDGVVDANRLFAAVVASYVAAAANVLGLCICSAIDEPGWGYTPVLPLAPATTFYLCALLASFLVTLATLWRLQGRRLVLSLVLRLVEQTLALGVCAAMFYRGYFILAVLSVVTVVFAGAVYGHTFGTFVALFPDDFAPEAAPVMLTSAIWAPLLLPVGPLMTLYGPLFVSRQRHEATNYVVRTFDVLVGARAFVVTTLPQLVLCCLLTALHQGFAPVLALMVAVSLWSTSLALRRFGQLQRRTGLEFVAGCPDLWAVVAEAVEEAAFRESHVAMSPQETARATRVIAEYSAARKRVEADREAQVDPRWAKLSSKRMATLYADESSGQVWVQEPGPEVPIHAATERRRRLEVDDAEGDARRAVMEGVRNASSPKRLPAEGRSELFRGAPSHHNAASVERERRWRAIDDAGGAHAYMDDGHGGVDNVEQDNIYPDVAAHSPVGGSVTPARSATPQVVNDRPPLARGGRHPAEDLPSAELVAKRQRGLLARHERRYPTLNSRSQSAADDAHAHGAGSRTGSSGPQPVDFRDVRRGGDHGYVASGQAQSPAPPVMYFARGGSSSQLRHPAEL
jgi:hypothetical protein